MKHVPPKVLLAIPTWGRVSTEWAEARSSIQWPLGASVATAFLKGEKIDIARNELAKRALAIGASHILYISDDVIVPPNIALQLLSRNVDIVTGVYWTKSFPKEPYIWRGVQQGPYVQWKHGEFFEIDMAGCDALLIKTDVFRRLEMPWFNCNWTWEPDTIPSSLSTEDFPFYLKAKAAGYKVWCDTCVQCGHQDRDSGIQFWLTEDMPQARQDVKAEDIKRTDRLCADIGCGEFSGCFDGALMRYDMNEKVKPDIRCDIHEIPEPCEKFDEVRARHVLEHFPAHEAPDLLKEWLRILKIGGKIEIEVPNLTWAMETVLKQEKGEGGIPTDEMFYAWGVLYGCKETGHEKNPAMQHKTGYTRRTLKNLFDQVGGVKDVEIADIDNRLGVRVTATKTFTHKADVLLDYWNQAEQIGNVTMPDGSDLEGEPEAETNPADTTPEKKKQNQAEGKIG